jgi:hypothetical protein
MSPLMLNRDPAADVAGSDIAIRDFANEWVSVPEFFQILNPSMFLFDYFVVSRQFLPWYKSYVPYYLAGCLV